MRKTDRTRRLAPLGIIPPFARLDHRLLLDEEGKSPHIESLPRNERRRLKASSKNIARSYVKIILDTKSSGSGYEIDKIIREMAVEYTNRYAESGTYTQPSSFNYVEPFCDLGFIENSVAPYLIPAQDINHLFHVPDYIDFVTDPISEFDLSDNFRLPDGVAFNYTPAGSILDFTFLSPSGREFLLAGFSMIRRGRSLHWLIIGGERHSEEEWKALCDDETEYEIDNVPRLKAKFLEHMVEKFGRSAGTPISLPGAERALRTLCAGEIDLTTSRHVGRYYASEFDKSFSGFCDDPEMFDHVPDPERRLKMLRGLQARVDGASVMWSLAESMLQLHSYFAFRLAVKKPPAGSGRNPPKTPRGGRGQSEVFEYVPSIELVGSEEDAIRPIQVKHYHVETEGYWRRLRPDENGYDASGNLVRGRTWVYRKLEWRGAPRTPSAIYVKSSIASARIQKEEYLQRAENADHTANEASATGVLYVLRCAAMAEEVYKVGWTSGTAEKRARELSSATGVPSSFIVVAYWEHPKPERLETGVHAMLAPYRVNSRREFFRVGYQHILEIVEREIARAER